jgi:hypothetical protein
MIRNRMIALAVAAVVAAGGLGITSAATSNATRAVAARVGPISTWSAYQPAGLTATYPEIDHTSVFNAYEQVYGN